MADLSLYEQELAAGLTPAQARAVLRLTMLLCYTFSGREASDEEIEAVLKAELADIPDVEGLNGTR